MRKMLFKCLLAALFLIVLLFSNSVFAQPVSFVKDYTYQASEADSKLTSRAIALEQVKRLLLEELGVYLQSNTEVINSQLTKDQITTYTAGIVKAVPIEEKWDGENYYLKAKLEADPDQVIKEIDIFRKDKNAFNELEKVRKLSEKQFKEIERLKEDLLAEKNKGTIPSNSDIVNYQTATKNFNLTNILENGITEYYLRNYNQAIDSFNNVIDKDNNNGIAILYLARAYKAKGDKTKALENYNKYIEYHDKNDIESRVYKLEQELYDAFKVNKNYNVSKKIMLEINKLTDKKGGIVFVQVVADEGKPMPKTLRVNIPINPGIMFVGEQGWNDDGYLLIFLSAGKHSISINHKDYKNIPLSFDVKINEITEVGVYKIERQQAENDNEMVKVNLNIKKYKADNNSGISVTIRDTATRRYKGISDENGDITIKLPKINNRWIFESDLKGYAKIWKILNVKNINSDLSWGSYVITPKKKISVIWELITKRNAETFDSNYTTKGQNDFYTYENYAKPPRSGFSFGSGEYNGKSCDSQDIAFIQSGDSHDLKAIDSDTFTTDYVMISCGNFACGPSGSGGIIDLGRKNLDEIYNVPQNISSYRDRNGIEAIEGHSYVMRTFDGNFYVKFKIVSIENSYH